MRRNRAEEREVPAASLALQEDRLEKRQAPTALRLKEDERQLLRFWAAEGILNATVDIKISAFWPNKIRKEEWMERKEARDTRYRVQN